MTPNDDTHRLIAAKDVLAALGLLSRLPVPVDVALATRRGALAAWAYPFAGAAIAGIAASAGQCALWAGLPAPLAAGLTLAAMVIITGALHEDGLADTADGLWGGWDRDRRLEIMKDSRIGAYGVIALILGLGLRWQALAAILDIALWPALIASAMLSRAAMVPLMTFLPNARACGLSQNVGRPAKSTALLAGAAAGLAAVVAFQTFGVVLLAVTALTAASCALIARAKIGGQTGDILGATQQITEISVLLTIAATL